MSWSTSSFSYEMRWHKEREIILWYSLTNNSSWLRIISRLFITTVFIWSSIIKTLVNFFICKNEYDTNFNIWFFHFYFDSLNCLLNNLNLCFKNWLNLTFTNTISINNQCIRDSFCSHTICFDPLFNHRV